VLAKFQVHFLAISDDCRTIQFEPEIENKVLKNHMIRSMSVERKSMCESQCFHEPNCMSFNYGPTYSDTPSCDLNDLTHLQAAVDDFVVEDYYIHRSFLVRSRNSYLWFTDIIYIHFVPTLFHNLNPDWKDQTKRNGLTILHNSLGLNIARYDCSISVLNFTGLKTNQYSNMRSSPAIKLNFYSQLDLNIISD